ncbi:MAG: DHH family phosphoesterase [Sphingobacteriales bacterium]|nr:DHH family phosphoesterase [Sphingobacteriales bacterium]
MMKITALQEYLNTARRIVITTHHRPDGDALGSSLAMYHFLKNHPAAHDVKVIVPSEYPDFLQSLPAATEVLVFGANLAKSLLLIEKSDLIFCLDYNAFHRTHTMESYLAQSKALKVLIDHHLQPDTAAMDFVLSDTSASSTCELVLDFLDMLGARDAVDTDIAHCLYAGLLTDTGRFKFSITPKVHETAAFLVKCGANAFQITDDIYESYSEDRLRLWGYAIDERMEVLWEYRTAIISLPAEVFRRFQYRVGDTEGLVNFPLSIKGIYLVALITENEGMVKLSLRSKGDFSVDEMARTHFEGGGHRNAAGGRSKLMSLEAVVQKFKDLLPLYAEQLQTSDPVPL